MSISLEAYITLVMAMQYTSTEKNRKTTWLTTIALILITAVIAFWTGRMSVENKVSSEYEAGFDAGMREGTTQWEEWK